MKKFQIVLALAAFAALTFGQAPQPPKKKKLLAIGAVYGFQHDSVSNGLATMWKIGHDTGLWDTYIRTDTQLITKKKVPAGNAKNLDYFDAIYIYTTGEYPLDDEQKTALLSFVHDDGKGIIGGHSAIDSNYKWPEYGEMMGAYFDQHPWGQFMAPIIIEDPKFPAMKAFPRVFTMMDEIYQPSKEFSREKLRVLARLDENKLDLTNKNVHRTDKDFAVAWVKTYGNGRVFYSTFGHREEVYDRPDIQAMYLEATKWVMKLTDADATPRPRP
jgi:type 1 glutamine amidotransferase